MAKARSGKVAVSQKPTPMSVPKTPKAPKAPKVVLVVPTPRKKKGLF